MITINGTAYKVVAPFREQWEKIGEMFRNYDGSLSSQVRSEKRRWTCTLLDMTGAQVETLRGVVATGVVVTVVDTLWSVSISARVSIEAQLSEVDLWTVSLDIRQV